jgi:hypothetical protein
MRRRCRLKYLYVRGQGPLQEERLVEERVPEKAARVNRLRRDQTLGTR